LFLCVPAEEDSALWSNIWTQWGTCADEFSSQADYFQFLLAAAKQNDVNVSDILLHSCCARLPALPTLVGDWFLGAP
jgi:hypothetical protein